MQAEKWSIPRASIRQTRDLPSQGRVQPDLFLLRRPDLSTISKRAMCSSTFGILAIIFMEAVEMRALALFGRCPLYLRYVDNCYALVKNKDGALALQACLNSQHSAIHLQLKHCKQYYNSTSLSAYSTSPSRTLRKGRLPLKSKSRRP